MALEKDNLIYGRNPVKEAFKANRVKRVFLINGFSDLDFVKQLEKEHISLSYVAKQELDNWCDGTHQGIAAEIKPYSYYSMDYLLKKVKEKEKPIILVLNGINDPHNFGAILRSAEIFDVSGVIIAKHQQVMLNATVAKTSAGAINYVPVILVSNLNQALRTLKENGFWVVSSDGSGQTNYNEINYDFPTVLVVGSEGNGISSLVLKNSDYIVKIPMYGHVNSLNASVATGIFLAKIRG